MALRELRDGALLKVLRNDSSRRDWAAQDSANDVQLPPAPGHVECRQFHSGGRGQGWHEPGDAGGGAAH